MVLTVYAHEIHIEQRSECLFDEIALVLTHKSLVNKNAGELFADGAREKSRRDRGIDTARKAENNLFVSDFSRRLFTVSSIKLSIFQSP